MEAWARAADPGSDPHEEAKNHNIRIGQSTRRPGNAADLISK
jgi:hypothetical protein